MCLEGCLWVFGCFFGRCKRWSLEFKYCCVVFIFNDYGMCDIDEQVVFDQVWYVGEVCSQGFCIWNLVVIAVENVVVVIGDEQVYVFCLLAQFDPWLVDICSVQDIINFFGSDGVFEWCDFDWKWECVKVFDLF